MLPDGPFATNPTTQLRLYSVQHLLWQNVEARLTPQELAKALLAIYCTSSLAWPFRDLFWALAARIAERLKLTAIDLGGATSRLNSLSDHTLTELAVKHGWGLGVAAPWGTSREADVLWAAAATLTKWHGCNHPNEIREDTSKGS